MGVKEFKEKLMADEEFAAKFKDVKTVEELIEKASKEGYEFTAEDVQSNVELSDDELESAAGGFAIFAKGWFVVKGGSIMADGYFTA